MGTLRVCHTQGSVCRTHACPALGSSARVLGRHADKLENTCHEGMRTQVLGSALFGKGTSAHTSPCSQKECRHLKDEDGSPQLAHRPQPQGLVSARTGHTGYVWPFARHTSAPAGMPSPTWRIHVCEVLADPPPPPVQHLLLQVSVSTQSVPRPRDTEMSRRSREQAFIPPVASGCPATPSPPKASSALPEKAHQEACNPRPSRWQGQRTRVPLRGGEGTERPGRD